MLGRIPVATGQQGHYMEKGHYVKDLTPPCEARGVFAVAQAMLGQSRNGPYWRLVLSDASGMLEAKIWSPLSGEFSEIPTGALAEVRGRVALFRDQPQLSLEAFRLLPLEECAALSLADFVPASPYDPDDMLAELHALAEQEFTHKPWRKFVRAVLNDAELAPAFRVCPAAKSVHHAYAGGLLEHSLGVFRLCRRLADQYPELDRQTLLAGALFHDIGKIREFSGGLVNDYTDEGRLIGHLELGIEMLEPFWRKAGLEPGLVRHLKHLILSHHGEPEYGAVRLPQTAEALVLHYADNIDAKMAQCRSLFAALEGDEGWTPYQNTLSRALFRGPRTPQTPVPRKEPRKPRSRPSDGNLLSLL